ncbi:MAG: T9SS type A sorting domain-containing protein, partial [Bacteroidales bacterium]|nr:T9SS type A sorting domain-containing protein [Bacteroidales bacterium]
MKTLYTLSILIACLVFTGHSQVTFIIDSLPSYTPPEDIIYIAGDFQGWNPGDPDYALQKNADDKWFITGEGFPNGMMLKFKFTRGSWATVEKGEFGEEIPDRQYTVTNGDTVYFVIHNWADNSGGNTTAAENVEIMDEDFYMPQLDRYRRIWIYLPPDYNETLKEYPVIYMHDGQNLFDAYTSFVGEWEVDETLNDLFDDGYQVPIVVGIDNGGEDRIDEYTPWVNPQYGGGDGDLYIDFIVETLKPHVDLNYRTLPDRENTAIWGSSLGGLISHYAALKYQDVFSKAGLYSPSYWFSDLVWSFTENMGHQQNMRLYQMTGDQEGGTMVQDTWLMHDTLTYLGFDESELSTRINPGEHNEQLWRSDFEDAYLWLFQTFASSIENDHAVSLLTVAPNPAKHTIHISGDQFLKVNELTVYNLQGMKSVLPVSIDGKADVSALRQGYYLLEVAAGNKIYRGKL